MAGYRKLGRTSDQRKALIRSQVTALLYHGHIRTTETRAKEIRKVAEGLIAMAVKEKDNFETVKVTAKVARKDKDGKRVKEVVDYIKFEPINFPIFNFADICIVIGGILFVICFCFLDEKKKPIRDDIKVKDENDKA